MAVSEGPFPVQVNGAGAVLRSPSRWLSIREIAEDLGVSTSSTYKWSARGRPFFPRSIRLRDGDNRVRRDWYEAWLEEMEAEA